MIYLAVLLASFVSIGLRAFQNLNVVNAHWLRVPPVSLGIACTDVLVVVNVAREGWGLVVFPLAVGGTLGCWAAMFLDREIERAEARGDLEA